MHHLHLFNIFHEYIYAIYEIVEINIILEYTFFYKIKTLEIDLSMESLLI